MQFPEDFVREALYAPEFWYLHELVEIDPVEHRVVGRIDTTRLGPIVDAQRPWPGHEKHLPGSVAIQVTGTLGNLHAHCILGLRASEGWVGYGTHVRDGRFKKLGLIGPPVLATATAHKRRHFRGAWFLDYTFAFEQEGELLYSSEQTAVWQCHGRAGGA